MPRMSLIWWWRCSLREAARAASRPGSPPCPLLAVAGPAHRRDPIGIRTRLAIACWQRRGAEHRYSEQVRYLGNLGAGSRGWSTTLVISSGGS